MLRVKNQRIKKGRDVFPCVDYQDNYCQECSGITTTKLVVIQRQGNRILSFYCKNCSEITKSEILSKIESINTVIIDQINTLKTIINTQNREIKKNRMKH